MPQLPDLPAIKWQDFISAFEVVNHAKAVFINVELHS
jgi:hypothetical protein